MFNIVLTFFPYYYKRKFFYHNQLQTIFYTNEPLDLSAAKVGRWAFLKSYNFFFTLLQTTLYQDL